MKRIKKFTMFVSEVSTLLTFPHTWTWENDENYKEYVCSVITKLVKKRSLRMYVRIKWMDRVISLDEKLVELVRNIDVEWSGRKCCLEQGLYVI